MIIFSVLSRAALVLILFVCFGVTSQQESCGDFLNRRKSIDHTKIESIENYALDVVAIFAGKDTHDVTFFCRNDFLLQGPKKARCFPNGSWSQEIPKCLEQCADLPGKIENIQVSTNKRTINSTVELSCRLPKYEFKGPKKLYCKHGGWSISKHKLKKAAYPTCKEKPTYTSWKVYLIGTGCVAGAILVLVIFLAVCIWTRKKHGKDIDGVVKANPDLLKSLFCVKVWSADREKRIVMVTESYKSLRNSVSLEFNINGRLVLEEDSTEIENDESLKRCKDKTLMVLAKNEQWKNSRWRQYNSSQSAAFHVFSHDRQKSVMILCFSLEDLCEQALHMLGYKPYYICLENDGTYLESDRDLMAFTGSRLMAVKNGCTWTVPEDGDFPHSSHYSANQERHMFVVRSLDGRKRKEIFASNVVGLHFAAATALKIQPPVEVTTNDGVLISDDATLSQHVHEVLTVTEVRKSRKLLLQNDTPRSSSVYSA
ncbi:uncharacterized protein LOC143051654 [Mytilus galloprovincialis]|uniref:uncharacterized protein LOC143051654 n=1 Tax=Mytilus galloprovincialis TaxID=29158 RepID=UPI003F7C3C56